MAQVCLKNSKTGEIIRVEKYTEADQYLKKHPEWGFCSKTEWKAFKKGTVSNGTQN